MSRVPLDITIRSRKGAALQGRDFWVFNESQLGTTARPADSEQVVIYDDLVGSGTLTQPLRTDASGQPSTPPYVETATLAIGWYAETGAWVTKPYIAVDPNIPAEIAEFQGDIDEMRAELDGAVFAPYPLYNSLSGSVASGAGTIGLSAPPPSGVHGYLAIEPYSVNCEIRQVSSVSGSTVTLTTALGAAHASSARVIFFTDTAVPAWWFGAKGDNASDDSAALQAAAVQTKIGSLWIDGGGVNRVYRTSLPLIMLPHGRLRNIKIAPLATAVLEPTNAALLTATVGPLPFTVDTSTNVVTITGSIGHGFAVGGVAVTFTAATDLVATVGAHGLTSGDRVSFTGGSLPPEVPAGQGFYAYVVSSTTYKLAPSRADAIDGTNLLDITVDGSGTTQANPPRGIQFRGSSLPAGIVAGRTYYPTIIDKFSMTLAETLAGATVDITSAGSGDLYSNICTTTRLYCDNLTLTGPTVIAAASSSTDTFTSSSAHGFVTGEPLHFDRDLPLPAGVTYRTEYFAVVDSPTTFRLSDTAAHALAGTNIVDLTTNSTGAVVRSGWHNGAMLQLQQPSNLTNFRIEQFPGLGYRLGGQEAVHVNLEIVSECGDGILFDGASFMWFYGFDVEGFIRTGVSNGLSVFPNNGLMANCGAYGCHHERNRVTGPAETALYHFTKDHWNNTFENVRSTGIAAFLLVDSGISYSGYTFKNITSSGTVGDTFYNDLIRSKSYVRGATTEFFEEISAAPLADGSFLDTDRNVRLGNSGRFIKESLGHAGVPTRESQPQSNQTADHEINRNKAGALAHGLNKDSQPYIYAQTLPADADIAASQVFWTFDATTGSPVVKFKGKDAGGTVFTHAVGPTYESKASAATVTLAVSTKVASITGTTTITSIAAGQAGREIALIFTGALTVTDGSNLKLNGNFVTAADSVMRLVSDGTNWYEVSRSTN
jgi:hypothetical protein